MRQMRGEREAEAEHGHETRDDAERRRETAETRADAEQRQRQDAEQR